MLREIFEVLFAGKPVSTQPDPLILDAPLWYHAPKLLLWCGFQAAIISEGVLQKKGWIIPPTKRQLTELQSCQILCSFQCVHQCRSSALLSNRVNSTGCWTNADAWRRLVYKRYLQLDEVGGVLQPTSAHKDSQHCLGGPLCGLLCGLRLLQRPRAHATGEAPLQSLSHRQPLAKLAGLLAQPHLLEPICHCKKSTLCLACVNTPAIFASAPQHV